MGHRAEQEPGEAAPTSIAEGQQVGALGPVEERLRARALHQQGPEIDAVGGVDPVDRRPQRLLGRTLDRLPVDGDECATHGPIHVRRLPRVDGLDRSPARACHPVDDPAQRRSRRW